VLELSWALNTWYANNPTAPHAWFILKTVPQLLSGRYETWYRIDILMYFFTSFFTSVWIWLFAAAWFVVKALTLAQPGVRFLLWLLPVRERPLASVGKVVALLAGIVAWAVMDVESVLNRL
jgi:hypothetical protein